MPTPIARWNPVRSVWETNETLICGHSDVWSETFPSSGMWVDGLVYELPTSAPRTDGSESSSSPGLLLGTPRCADGMAHNLRDGVENPRGRLEDQVSMLPTPTARDWKGEGPADANRKSPNLSAVNALLPTPTATPYGNNQSPSPGAAVRPSLDSLAPTLTTDGATAAGSPSRTASGARKASGELPLLLPTPKATDGTKGGPNQRGSSGDLTMPSVVHALLPTPTAQAAKHAADARGPGTLDDHNLWSVAARLSKES